MRKARFPWGARRSLKIGGLTDQEVVVISGHQNFATWAGTVEALKAAWCPMFVREAENVPRGNRELLKLGAVPLSEADLKQARDLAEWMSTHKKSGLAEPDLFDSLRNAQAEAS